MFTCIFRWRALRTAFLALVAALILAACGGSGDTGTFTNPVYNANFPDPFVLKAGNTYYAYSTNSPLGGNVPTIKSTDLVHWTKLGEAFPVTPNWLDRDIWAPTVIGLKNGRYILYYAAHDPNTNTECLGIAFGPGPAGPFADRSTHPYICQTDRGGDIDPDVFRDPSGTLYLYWKNDGNCCGDPDFLWGQKLSPDGKTLIGAPVKLASNDQGWEGQVIEAPFMWKHGNSYFLFYSGNAFDSPQYAIGYSVCKGPLGPCTDNPKNPVMQTVFGKTCEIQGPGGETIITDAKGQDWMMYHGWKGANVGDDQGGIRALYMDPLNWQNGQPVVGKPTCKTSPAPAK